MFERSFWHCLFQTSNATPFLSFKFCGQFKILLAGWYHLWTSSFEWEVWQGCDLSSWRGRLWARVGQVLEEDSALGDKTDSAHCPKGAGHPSGWERGQLMVRHFSTRLSLFGYYRKKRKWEEKGLAKKRPVLTLKMKSDFPFTSACQIQTDWLEAKTVF